GRQEPDGRLPDRRQPRPRGQRRRAAIRAPPLGKAIGVEVMSVRGARLLLDLLQRSEAPAGGSPGDAAPARGTTGVPAAARVEALAGALQAALRQTGGPADAARILLPAIAAAAGLAVAGLATPGPTGFT